VINETIDNLINSEIDSMINIHLSDQDEIIITLQFDLSKEIIKLI
jgi:hypothetical protein